MAHIRRSRDERLLARTQELVDQSNERLQESWRLITAGRCRAGKKDPELVLARAARRTPRTHRTRR